MKQKKLIYEKVCDKRDSKEFLQLLAERNVIRSILNFKAKEIAIRPFFLHDLGQKEVEEGGKQFGVE